MILFSRRRMGAVWERRFGVVTGPPRPGAGLYILHTLAATT